MEKQFKNVVEILDYFKDEKKCKELIAFKRWGGKPVCPFCAKEGIITEKIYITSRGYKCGEKTCQKKFTVTVGTVLENTKIPLRLWMVAIYLTSAHKKGISSYQLARDIGVTQKTGWFMLGRIRELMKEKAGHLLSGIVEVDETFIGGKRENKHLKQRIELGKKGTGYVDMSPVVGILQRGDGKTSKVINITVPGHKVNGEILKPIVKANIQPNSTLVTDGFGGYYGLHDIYTHEVIQHSKEEFVRGKFHTNGIENYWSLLKRGIIGIYHQVSQKHLHRYCNEFAYRFNSREITDQERFFISLSRIAIHGHLTYKEYIKNT